MAAEFQCPTCGQDLAIRAGTPPGTIVTCPRCLASLAIPHPATIDTQTSSAQSPPPRPVIPLDAEVISDQRASNRGLVIVSLLLIGGGIWAAFSNQIGTGLTMIAAGVVGGVIVSILNAAAERRTVARLRDDRGPVMEMADPGGVLPYRAAGRERHETWRAMAAFIVGFFTAMGLCIGSIVLMASTAAGPAGATKQQTHMLVLSLVSSAIVGLVVASIVMARKKIYIGFGRGVAVGLTLGLLAVGPSALCYMSL